MKLLLVTGGIHDMVEAFAPRNIEIVNAERLELGGLQDYAEREKPPFEAVLVGDEALTHHVEQDRGDLERFLQALSAGNRADVPVLVLTRNPMLEAGLQETTGRYANLRVSVCDSVRLPASRIREEMAELRAAGRSNPRRSREPDPSPLQEEGERRRSFLDRFRFKAKHEAGPNAADPLTRRFESISRGISRVIAVTGHRGSGVTSTAVNIACEAGKRGLSTILVDMDIDYRAANMYFSSFHETTKRDEEMGASLIRTMARPQDYKTTAFPVKHSLWLASLGYEFADRKLVEQLYTDSRLIGMLSVLRAKFNVVVVDIPLDVLSRFREAMIHIDRFGLCVPNNLHAVISTLRNAETALAREQVGYLNAKSQVVVTRYQARSKLQDEAFTPEKVCEIMASGLSPLFAYEMAAAGAVPYGEEFDAQIETDVPLAEASPEYEKAYAGILLRLLEGAP